MTAVLDEAYKQVILSNIPAGRMGTPEDIANAVLFFASPDSSFVTGQILTVDGGMIF